MSHCEPERRGNLVFSVLGLIVAPLLVMTDPLLRFVCIWISLTLLAQYFPLMKKGSFFIFLLFIVVFLLPLSCAYSCYNEIVEVDSFTPGDKYESADIENLVFDKQTMIWIIALLISFFSFLASNFSGPSLFLYHSSALIQIPSSVLRC